jgi:hypothetical protein
LFKQNYIHGWMKYDTTKQRRLNELRNQRQILNTLISADEAPSITQKKI